MKYLAILLVIYLFLKSFYYGLFEIKKKDNIVSGIAIIILSTITLIIPLFLLFTIY